MNNRTPSRAPRVAARAWAAAGRFALGLCLRMKSPWPDATLPWQWGWGHRDGAPASLGPDAQPRVGQEGREPPCGQGPDWTLRPHAGAPAGSPLCGADRMCHPYSRSWRGSAGGVLGRAWCWACTPTVQASPSGDRASVSPPVKREPVSRPLGAAGRGERVSICWSSKRPTPQVSGGKRRAPLWVTSGTSTSQPHGVGQVHTSGLASKAPRASYVAAAPQKSVSSSLVSPLCG